MPESELAQVVVEVLVLGWGLVLVLVSVQVLVLAPQPLWFPVSLVSAGLCWHLV